jgi:Ser-tRNA(Ala) deacylase AlaX
MTQKIFWQDPYLTHLDTVVTSVNGDDITVERTILYALSGGQESDHGTISQRRVIGARKDGRAIIYTLEAGHGLQPGEAVTMQLDWEWRYQLMRLHFAAEIVLALVYQQAAGIQKIGAHIAPDKARIDFVWDANIAALFPAIQSQACALIEADREIISAFSDEAREQRYWEIRGFARVACGGTHLRRTGEVGNLTLKRKNIGRGKERIEIYFHQKL